MNKYGWKEGQGGHEIEYCFETCATIIIACTGLGKSEQGISTALAVEKTSKRGGKIINVAAEQGWYGTLLIAWGRLPYAI